MFAEKEENCPHGKDWPSQSGYDMQRCDCPPSEKPLKYLIVSGPDGYQSRAVEGEDALKMGILNAMECVGSFDEAQPETREMIERIIDPEAEWRTDIPAWHSESFEDGFLHVLLITE